MPHFLPYLEIIERNGPFRSARISQQKVGKDSKPQTATVWDLLSLSCTPCVSRGPDILRHSGVDVTFPGRHASLTQSARSSDMPLLRIGSFDRWISCARLEIESEEKAVCTRKLCLLCDNECSIIKSRISKRCLPFVLRQASEKLESRSWRASPRGDSFDYPGS
jgi:hypothetical protein